MNSLMKTALVATLVATATPAMAEMSNTVYGAVGYSHHNTAANKTSGYNLMAGDRFQFNDAQAVRVEGEFGQSRKKDGVKTNTYDIRTNYEHAFAVADGAYIIPTAGVGYHEHKFKGDVDGKLKGYYGEVGVRGQVATAGGVLMPELVYQKDLQTKVDGDKIKKGDGIRAGITFSHDLKNDMAVFYGAEHKWYKNKEAYGKDMNVTSVKVGMMF